MRTFEIILVVLACLSAFAAIARNTSKRSRCFLGLVDIGALLIHLVIEGAHWQIIPVYGAFLIFVSILLARWSRLRAMGGWAMLLLTFSACCFVAVVPIFRLPKPTGTSLIGTQILHFFKSSSSAQQKTRELVVQLWYPAAPSRDAYAPYRRRAETTLKSSYQSVLKTHSRWNAAVATGNQEFPILLFNPSWTGRRTQNTYLSEDLASHGYVVVGIDHPGNSGPIALLNGQVLQPVAELDLDFRTKTLQEIESLAEEELSKETEDTLFVLDQMERLNEDSSSPFFHRLDTRSVGAFGHSFGGAVAAEACLQDSRIESALVLSGSLFGRVQREGLPKMIMMLEEDPPQFSESELQRSNEARIDDALDIGDDEVAQRSPGYRIFLHGSSHTGFTDHSLFSNFESLTGGGKTPPYRQFSIIRAYAVAFFDKTLRGIESPILAPGAHPFPEASFKVLPNGRSSAPLTAP